MSLLSPQNTYVHKNVFGHQTTQTEATKKTETDLPKKKTKKLKKKNAILTNRIGKITTKVKKFRFNQIFEMLKHLQQ